MQKIDYWPFKALMTFLIITELLFFIGPLQYSIPNKYMLFIYLAILNVFFYTGYKKGVTNFKPSYFYVSQPAIKCLIFIGFLLTVYDLIHTWSLRGLDLSIDSLLFALSNPGDAYYAETLEENTSYFMLLLSPIAWATIPLGIANWNNMSKFYKAIIVVSVLLVLFKWLGIGTRKGITDILLITFFCLIAKDTSIITDAAKKRRFYIILVSIVFIFLVFFTFSNISRGGGSSLSELNDMSVGSDIRPLYSDLPIWLIISLSGIVGYLCQGYYALGISLSMGLRPIVPLGMSWFTIAIAKKFDYDPTPLTYMHDLERYGIDMSVNWHSIYVWLANDFSFIGVPFVIYLIGYLFAQTWMDAKNGGNILAFPTFSLFIVMVFYFFANNQILSFSFIPFVCWLLIYKLSKNIAK